MMKRFLVPEKDNAAYPKRASSGGRPGVGKDGAPGVPVQSMMPRELVERLDEWATSKNMGRGPAVRKLVESSLEVEAMIAKLAAEADI